MTYTPSKVTARQRKYTFPNGYGASVINDGYGSESGHLELAVLKDGRLTYETPITDDVLGFLTEEEVQETLDRIAALTPEGVAVYKVEHRRAEIHERIAELREELARLESEV